MGPTLMTSARTDESINMLTRSRFTPSPLALAVAPPSPSCRQGRSAALRTRLQPALMVNTAPPLPPQPDTARGARMLYWARLVAMAAGVTDANH